MRSILGMMKLTCLTLTMEDSIRKQVISLNLFGKIRQKWVSDMQLIQIQTQPLLSLNMILQEIMMENIVKMFQRNARIQK